MRHPTPSLLILLLAALSVVGCASPFGLSVGSQCELNSDCDAPLVCRIGYCRNECSTARDCGAGLNCVQDNEKLGACQLPVERRCTNNSACPAPLVCTMGQCSNACGSCTVPGPCRDCPTGADCVLDTDGELGCFDPSTRSCVYSSECAANEDEFVCASDGRCRVECRSDCDCRFGEVCRERAFEENDAMVMGTLCVLPTPPDRSTCLPDGSVTASDGGAIDASVFDAGVVDATTADAP